MKIALTTKDVPKENPDASFTTVVNLAKELKKRKNDVTIITNRGFSDTKTHKRNEKEEVRENVRIFRPYYLPWFNLHFFKKYILLDPTSIFNRFFAAPLGVRKMDKKESFSIVHSFGGANLMVLQGLIAKLFSKRARLVHTIKSRSFFKLFGKFKFTFLLNKADKLTVPNRLFKKELINAGCRKELIEVVHSPVDLTKFKSGKNAALRKKLNLPNKKIVMYYGHLVETKGWRTLLESIELIKDDIFFLFVVPPEQNPDAVKFLKSYKKIRLIADKVNVADYVNASDVVVLPYWNMKNTIANPLCLLESMACKTPVITTDVPEFRDLFESEKEVLMVKPKDPKSLAENIVKLLNNKKLQKRLVENSSKKVKEFDAGKIADQYINIYNEVLSGS
ncbi:glycosyltransferase family 4 protein [Nanoarchaeota archaeon]